jgi:hypothetical protein
MMADLAYAADISRSTAKDHDLFIEEKSRDEVGPDIFGATAPK